MTTHEMNVRLIKVMIRLTVEQPFAGFEVRFRDQVLSGSEIRSYQVLDQVSKIKFGYTELHRILLVNLYEIR